MQASFAGVRCCGWKASPRVSATSAPSTVSLVVPKGQLVGVIGRSGAGKSTLLRMINRLSDPTSGRIFFGDTDVTALSGRTCATGGRAAP